MAKHRDLLVLEAETHELERHRDAAHIGRIRHADELHAVMINGARLHFIQFAN